MKINYKHIAIVTLTIPFVLVVMYYGWTFLSSKNYDQQVSFKKESIVEIGDGQKSAKELEFIFSSIKDKRQKTGETSTLSSDEMTYAVRSLPFPAEVYNRYQVLKKEHNTYLTDKEQFEKQTQSSTTEVTYSGVPSSLDNLKKSKNRILFNWLKSIFFGLIIGFIISLHPIIQQALGWFFKLSLALSPMLLMVVGMILFSRKGYHPEINQQIINWGLSVYGILIVSYFAGHRNSILLKSSNKEKDFYYNFGFGAIFNGLRVSLYLLIPLSLSLELLTQVPGVGSRIWEMFQNGAWGANTEIILLSLLITFFALKTDIILSLIQYLLKYLGAKNASQKIKVDDALQ